MSDPGDAPAPATPLVVVGAGGMGREVLEVVEAVEASRSAAGLPPAWRLLGVVDDAASAANAALLARRGVTLLGPTAVLDDLAPDVHVVLGVGSGAARASLARATAGRPAATLVHPSATVGVHVALGEGTVVCQGARVTTDAVLGRHVIVNSNAAVAHDCRLGDFVTVNPLAALSGGCTVGDGATIGAHAVVLQGLEVGSGATVGAQACVVRPVPVGAVVKGVPAR
ncbi:NeuD/PglB/VioB family sugar acetyltransferase [Lapillicoccus jejuensis]|uniref:Sugar O-acyltransferase (Sialic acid O-acetyltransferase NeuD family) n=1 Tax=Lapillicoccus jejuensis TaxID=402171 RepID=A0A542DW48_9MICO|nr:NeuD/PglB/VioB family sugar acetyltransferase [Lapillicoccus jejuensis]TQJ07275.1 sugar O-acyltransferase (sialic acid O-acetyltransferase NeuD family) [Lapillicoccus jejuensis]